MQKIRFSKYFKAFNILLDMILVAVVFCLFYFWKFGLKFDSDTVEQNILSIIILCFFWLLLSGRTKIFYIQRNLTFTKYLERVLTHIFLFFIGVLLLGKISDNNFLKTERFYLAVVLFLFIIPVKTFIFFGLKYFRKLGVNHRNVMFIGDSTSIKILKQTIYLRKDYGYKVFDYPYPILESNQLEGFITQNGIHTIFLSSEVDLDEAIKSVLFKSSENNKLKITLVPNIVKNDFFEYQFNYIETVPVLTQIKYPLDIFTNVFIKRVFDIVFSLIVLIGICSWLFPIIILLIKLDDNKGKVFFVQKRYGYHDNVFDCYKFRTMKSNKEAFSKTTDTNDVRITKIGRLLRKTSLDEMPQFINVLLGQMSVVGPRPHMLMVDDFYKPRISRYSLRSMVKPGITGLAQVNGLRGDDGDMNIEMKKRIIADAFYVRNWSLSMDVVIIFKTIFLMLIGDEKAR